MVSDGRLFGKRMGYYPPLLPQDLNWVELECWMTAIYFMLQIPPFGVNAGHRKRIMVHCKDSGGEAASDVLC